MRVEVRTAIQNKFAAGVEIASLEVSAVKPLGMGKAAAVGENHVKNLAACSRLNDAASIDARVNGRVLSDFQGRQGNKARAILVGLGNMKEEVFNGSDAPR